MYQPHINILVTEMVSYLYILFFVDVLFFRIIQPTRLAKKVDNENDSKHNYIKLGVKLWVYTKVGW